MNTKNFNFIDKIIANLRLSKIIGSVKNGDEILDFGCGSKSFLLESVDNKIKIGVGLDPEVKNKKKGNIKYIKYKFSKELPFSNDSFDKIFLLAVLEHIDISQVNKLFLEFERILSYDGEIILTTPTPKSKKVLEFLAYKMKIISSEEIKDHKKYYKKEDLVKLIKKSNLKLNDYNLFQFGLNSYAVFKKNN